MKTVRYVGALLGVTLMVSMEPAVAAACDSCWGAAVDSPTTRGITMAMLALIGMTSVVWGGIGAFFLHVRHRTRMLEPGDLMVNEYGDIESRET